MIYSIFIVNAKGDIKLTRFWSDPVPDVSRDVLVRSCFQAVSIRKKTMCNFVEHTNFLKRDRRIIYRRYNALYFIVVVDETESCLAMLDFIQYFVEAMDKCIPDVCELDVMINNVLVHAILDEMVIAGFLLPTTDEEVVDHMEKQQMLHDISKNSVLPTSYRTDQFPGAFHRSSSSLN